MTPEDWSSLTAATSLRATLDAGAALGGWVTLADPVGAEILARAGYDWIGVDAQHGSAAGSLLSILQALAITRTPALVRVARNDPALIGTALDAGAVGVIVPMIETAEQAASAVAACRHAPAGVRSWGSTRATLGLPGLRAPALSDAALCFVMAETRGAVEQIDAIVAVPGLDGVFVGPSDLAISIGRSPGEQSDELASLIERVGDACAAAGIAAGIYAGESASAQRWAAEGYRLIALHNDARLLLDAAREQLALTRRS